MRTVRRTRLVQIRTTPAERSEWIAAARRERVTIAELVRASVRERVRLINTPVSQLERA